MGQLFENPNPENRRPDARSTDRRVSIAINANVWGTYTYLWPAGLGTATVGQRVRVPFGRSSRTTLGFVTEIDAPESGYKLKPVSEVIDQTPQLDEHLMDLGRWISQYYLAPLGMTLAAMVPSAVGKHPPRRQTIVKLVSSRADWPNQLGQRQMRVLDELEKAARQGVAALPLDQLRQHSQASRDTIGRLVQRELIRTESRPVVLDDLSTAAEADPFEVNPDQQAVLDQLAGRLDAGFSVTVLHGVTGSGKTEVYVRAIRKVIAAGRQAILLVPEIALATQTLQRLLKRLPRVAMLHSQLTDAQRAFYWRQIRTGHASVIVGPRSAIFAPARSLGLIIVDEEHESSYKQDTAPRYHGRDVAVMRANLAGCPVILGSATPSMESWQNVKQGKYHLARLPRRVKSLPMPQLELVSLRKEIRSEKVELIGRTMMQHVAAVLDRGEQAILLMNRRGFASYVFCPSCQWALSCDECTRMMVFHQSLQLAMCHYCDRTRQVPEACPACGGKILLFGMGIQRVEGELARKFPAARFSRMDSDTMTSARQFQAVFDDFAAGNTDILLGTQMVAKGLDFPKVSLVGVLSADTSLAIPDFRASERTFQLIVQVAGRAGRSATAGRVVVQSVHPDEPAIQYALQHDFEGFADWELPAREATNLPPFSRIIRFIIRHANHANVQQDAGAFADRLGPFLQGLDCTVQGPSPAEVLKIRNQYRHQVLVITNKPGLLQRRIYPRFAELTKGLTCEVLADVDPASLI
ncbi:MAG: replication restart helicase PriA [Planctomycetota bacterium]